MQEITQDLVKELFNYNDGNLYWKVANSNRIKIGDIAGTLDKNHNYYRIKINYKNYFIHKIIFLYHYGYYPKIIDHIDNNSLNNKIENLREVTVSQNAMNKKGNKNSTSIYKGVNWNKKNKKWITKIQINGKGKYLGSFKSESSAAKAYNEGATKYFGKYARLNKLGE